MLIVKRKMKTNKKISIVFLAWNGINETEKALESIFRYTTVPFELILVNNGSSDGVGELFDNIKKRSFYNDKYCYKINVVHNSENLGVSKGYNAGLKNISNDTDYISIYSNDWICTPKWAEKMIRCLESEPMCGFASAACNASATSNVNDPANPNPRIPETIDWDDPELFEKVNAINTDLEKVNDSMYSVNRFVCMGWLMKREVFDKVGLMDEKIKQANDVSYSFLAYKYGYISKTCWDTYFHHFLQVSSKQIPREEQMKRDREDWHRVLTDPLYKKEYMI